MFKGVSHPGPEQRCLSERAAFRSSLVAVEEAESLEQGRK